MLEKLAHENKNGEQLWKAKNGHANIFFSIVCTVKNYKLINTMA